MFERAALSRQKPEGAVASGAAEPKYARDILKNHGEQKANEHYIKLWPEAADPTVPTHDMRIEEPQKSKCKATCN